MRWKEAHERIEGSITIGTYLGIKEFQGVLIATVKYDGFKIRIGENRTFNLKWFVLEHCWKAMNERRIFNLNIFKDLFGDECLGNPALVDIVGRIFLKAGLAKFHDNIYHNFTERLFHQLPLQLDSRPAGGV